MLNPYVPGGSTSKGKSKEDEHFIGPIGNDPPDFGRDNAISAPVLPAVQPVMPSPVSPVARTGGDSSSMPAIPAFQFTEDRLNNMLGSNSRFMREAERRGLEIAGTRGGLNSSIAAGLSTREAIRAAAPIAQADAQFTQEDYLTGRRAVLDNSLRENDSVRTMRRDSLLADFDARRLNQEADLTSQRDRNLSALRRQEMAFDTELTQRARDNDAQRDLWFQTQSGLTNSYIRAMDDARRSGLGFAEQLGQAFINDPEVFSPEVVSGMSNFFNSIVRGQTDNAIRRTISDIIGLAPPSVIPGGVEGTQPVRPPGG